jgi:uncharacterized protein YjfI (DUF2170 family)
MWLAQDTVNEVLGFKNKIFYLIKAVPISSVSCSSVKTDRYFDVMNFSVEYTDSQ